MHKSSRTVRTWGLLVVAVILIAIGMASYMSTEWELSLGPTTPVAKLPPKAPGSEDNSPLETMGLIQGLAVSDIGLPSHIAVGSDKLYVVDAYASAGVIKVYDLNGVHLFSFGNISQEELNYVVGLRVNNAQDIVVLDASATLFVYTQTGKLIKQMELNNGTRPELAWARTFLPVSDGYYVLALDKVYRFDLEGRFVASYPGGDDSQTLAMAPSEFYLGPSGLALWGSYVWVSDSVNGRLLRLGANDKFDHSVTLPTKDGIDPYPTTLLADSEGNFLVIDAARQVLLKISQSGEVLGEAQLGSSSVLEGPDDVYSLAIAADGTLFVSDSHRGSVVAFAVAPKLTKMETLISSTSRFLFPSVVAVLEANVYIVSGEPALGQELGYKVYRTDLAGASVEEFITSWSGDPLYGPTSIQFYNNQLYLLDGPRVLVFDRSGTPLCSFGEDTTDWGGFGAIDLFGYVEGPKGMAFNTDGQLWVADTNRHRLVVFDADGTFLKQVALGSEVWPQSITFAPDGTLLILNGYEGQIMRIDTSGKVLATYGSPGQGPGQLGVVADVNRLGGPRDVVVDGEGNIYVVDTYNSRIVSFTPKGLFESSVGTFGSGMGEVYLPSSMTYQAASDSFYLADTYNHRIQIFKIK